MTFDPSRRGLLAGATSFMSAASVAQAVPAASDLNAHMSVSILDWGVRGNNDPTDGERIQRAFDEAPLGGNLYFPPGDFRTRQPLRLRRHLNLVGSGGTRLTGEFDPKSTDALLDINVEDPGNRDNRNQRIQGLRMWLISGLGDGLAFRNLAPNIANIGLIIENNLISGSGASGPGYAIRLEGIGTHHLTVRNNQLINGVYVASADGVTIEECLIWGEKPGVTLDLIPGAFQTRILRNAIVTRDGALRVLNGSQIYFEYNQVEQPPQANQAIEGAHIAIVPSKYGSRHIRVRSNNFGGGDNARLAIYASGDCQDLLIDDNVFNWTSSGVDVNLADAAVMWTRISSSNAVRQKGTRRAMPNAGLLRVRDEGVGTFGVENPGSALDPAFGWRPAPTFRFWKTLDGVARFEGTWLCGKATKNTRIGILPVGFRPRLTTRLILPTDTGELTMLDIMADGAIIVILASGNSVDWSGVSFVVAPRPDYPASDP